ncbi:MAG: hypothetical protein P4M12_10160 [Gammaproteobacteria bacterium]|nr:hypothetical protein [Gammaproteobacteria bacterium]
MRKALCGKKVADEVQELPAFTDMLAETASAPNNAQAAASSSSSHLSALLSPQSRLTRSTARAASSVAASSSVHSSDIHIGLNTHSSSTQWREKIDRIGKLYTSNLDLQAKTELIAQYKLYNNQTSTTVSDMRLADINNLWSTYFPNDNLESAASSIIAAPARSLASSTAAASSAAASSHMPAMAEATPPLFTRSTLRKDLFRKKPKQEEACAASALPGNSQEEDENKQENRIRRLLLLAKQDSNDSMTDDQTVRAPRRQIKINNALRQSGAAASSTVVNDNEAMTNINKVSIPDNTPIRTSARKKAKNSPDKSTDTQFISPEDAVAASQPAAGRALADMLGNSLISSPANRSLKNSNAAAAGNSNPFNIFERNDGSQPVGNNRPVGGFFSQANNTAAFSNATTETKRKSPKRK